MSYTSQITVLKFGSSVLRTEKDLPRAVHEIYQRWRRGQRVLAVVSAFGGVTDRLLGQALRHYKNPEPHALATLLATGETTAAALLGLALNKAGVPATVLDPAQIELRTAEEGLDARPLSVNGGRIWKELEDAIVVFPGFVGRDAQGATTLLGRGGSDYSALFLARALGADCVLLKDVDGLYTADPAVVGSNARRFSRIHWASAIALGGGVVQPKAISDAQAHGQSFSVTACGALHATVIGPGIDTIVPPSPATRPLKVALLGCGTVGSGVYRRLAALPELFAVTGVFTRKPTRARAAGVPDRLLHHDNAGDIGKIPVASDVVVELIGGMEPAGTLIRTALNSGRHVITANKALIAVHKDELAALALAQGVSLRYSAAVGGALPALECVQALAAQEPLRAISGILNGTTNYILERLAAGDEFPAALKAAQIEGFAEANPAFDLDGTDAVQKLVLLARAAGDAALQIDKVQRAGIAGLDGATVRAARARGHVIRLVATWERSGAESTASVRPVELPTEHPFAHCRGAENRLRVETGSGEVHWVSGIGAGRWPAAEAVLADLFELRESIFSAAVADATADENSDESLEEAS